MRETRPSGSEGGGAELNQLSLPLSASWAVQTIHGVNLQGSRPRSCASFRESGERLQVKINPDKATLLL